MIPRIIVITALPVTGYPITKAKENMAKWSVINTVIEKPAKTARSKTAVVKTPMAEPSSGIKTRTS
jgi:hypothetical protein